MVLLRWESKETEIHHPAPPPVAACAAAFGRAEIVVVHELTSVVP